MIELKIAAKIQHTETSAITKNASVTPKSLIVTWPDNHSTPSTICWKPNSKGIAANGISSLRRVARNVATPKTDNPVPAMKLAVAEKHIRCRSTARLEIAGHNKPFLNPVRRIPATT